MRTYLVATTVAVFLFISIPFYYLFNFVTRNNVSSREALSFRIVNIMFRLILWISGAKVTVIGRDNIPADEPVLYVSNHRSHFDILVGYTNVRGLTGFVSKKELGKIPMLKQWMINLNCIFLDRSNPKEGLKAILQGVDNINRGISMFICPEGTRQHQEDMGTFKEGSLKMAQKTGCRVVPVLMYNTENLFEKTDHKVSKAKVLIEFGEPVDLNTLEPEDKKHAAHYMEQKIRAMMEVHQNEDI